jgi:hypothetical protein
LEKSAASHVTDATARTTCGGAKPTEIHRRTVGICSNDQAEVGGGL